MLRKLDAFSIMYPTFALRVHVDDLALDRVCDRREAFCVDTEQCASDLAHAVQNRLHLLLALRKACVIGSSLDLARRVAAS